MEAPACAHGRFFHMSESRQQAVGRLLGELEDGHRESFDELFRLVYDEVHALAHAQRQRWHGDYTLNTTALVHEAYLKLVDQSRASWQTEAHFLATAAKAIRHILINYAESRTAQKRGGRWTRVNLSDLDVAGPASPMEAPDRWLILLSLDAALDELARIDTRRARIVECRFFGGMTIGQTAAALGISAASVSRGWAVAQAWLYRALNGERAGEEAL
jgi:RNA polymerase sigma factor (TIGR02999 family)